MGYEVSRADARKLLEDKKLMDEVVREALAISWKEARGGSASVRKP